MVPDNGAYWPRFRGNAQQTGRSPVRLRPIAVDPWTYGPRPSHPERPGDAARGIFNSAVVSADGTIWSGDGSGRLSRLATTGRGQPEAQYELGRLIDTTPLLLGNALYVSCGDGRIWRASPPEGPLEKWFEADPPRPPAFINWFEGHLGVDGHGNIVAPNDNFHVYVIDAATARAVAKLEMRDQTWSLACVDPGTRAIYFGNNAMKALGDGAANVYGWSAGGEQLWSYTTLGSVVASPAFHDGWIYVGSFDGSLYAFDLSRGGVAQWTCQTRDHLYASPVILRDGTVVQAGCDGTVYALDPKSGALRWRYDLPLPNPVRSSPAVDEHDRIWIGTGDGHMLILDRDGRPVRAPYRLAVPGPRRAVNASPAIGPGGIVIGDSEGALHLVPWQVADERGEPQQSDAVMPPDAQRHAFLRPVDRWGVVQAAPPEVLSPGEPLCFAIDAMERTDHGDARMLGLLESVQAWPPQVWSATVSGDRRYVIVEPEPGAAPGERLQLKLTCQWRYAPERKGLKMWGGTLGAEFTARCEVTVRRGMRCEFGPPAMLWYQRIVMALPGLLPSYNQIGFETLVYGMTRVCPLAGDEWLYLVTGWSVDGRPDPQTRVRFPLRGHWDAATGTLRLRETDVHSELNGFDTLMKSFAVTGWFDPGGQVVGAPVLRISYTPDGVGFYGEMLRALGMGDEEHPIQVFGSGELRVGTPAGPPLDAVQWFKAGNGDIVVGCRSRQDLADSLLALVVVDAQGQPVVMDYAAATTRMQTPGGATLHLRPRQKHEPWSADSTVWLVADGVPHRAVPG